METGGCDTVQQSPESHRANPKLFCRAALQSALTCLANATAASKRLVEQHGLATGNGMKASVGVLQVIGWTCLS